MIRLLTILSCLALTASALEPGVSNESTNRPQYNFLFIVDTSQSMSRKKETAVKLMRDVITSGFNSQIEPGDSIDIWTYDSQNHISSFPPLIWEEAEVQRIATTAALFIEDIKFKGRSSFNPVAADLESLVPHSKNLLTFIITDADPAVARIPLDLEINEAIAADKTLSRSRNPLLISLAATNGHFHQWAVDNGEGRLFLATLPVRPKPEPKIAKVDPQNNAELKPKNETAPEPPVVINYPPGTRITPLAFSKNEPKPVAPVLTEDPLVLETIELDNTPDESPANPVPTVAAVTPTPPRDLKTSHSQKDPAPATSEPIQVPAIQVPTVISNSVANQAPSTSTVVAAAAVLGTEKETASERPEPAPGIENPIVAINSPAVSTSAIYLAIVTGLSIFGGGVYLAFRRLRARHGSSIISKSLLQR